MNVGDIYESIILNEAMGTQFKIKRIDGYHGYCEVEVVGYGELTIHTAAVLYPIGTTYTMNLNEVEKMELI